MRADLYSALAYLTARLERAGLNCCGSFAYDETRVVVDFWRPDGAVGSVEFPMPFAVMPSLIVRRAEVAR